MLFTHIIQCSYPVKGQKNQLVLQREMEHQREADNIKEDDRSSQNVPNNQLIGQVLADLSYAFCLCLVYWGEKRTTAFNFSVIFHCSKYSHFVKRSNREIRDSVRRLPL